MESKFIRVHDILLREINIIKERENNMNINNVEATRLLIEELQTLKSQLYKPINKQKGRL